MSVLFNGSQIDGRSCVTVTHRDGSEGGRHTQSNVCYPMGPAADWSKKSLLFNRFIFPMLLSYNKLALHSMFTYPFSCCAHEKTKSNVNWKGLVGNQFIKPYFDYSDLCQSLSWVCSIAQV